MANTKQRDVKVLATLVKQTTQFGKRGGIVARFKFDLQKTQASKKSTDLESLFKMRRTYVSLKEPDREAKRPDLANVYGRLLDLKIPKAPAKEGQFEVWFDLDEAQSVIAALMQIGECEPPTVIVCETQREIEFTAEDEAETDAEIDELFPDAKGRKENDGEWPGASRPRTTEPPEAEPKRRGRKKAA